RTGRQGSDATLAIPRVDAHCGEIHGSRTACTFQTDARSRHAYTDTAISPGARRSACSRPGLHCTSRTTAALAPTKAVLFNVFDLTLGNQSACTYVHGFEKPGLSPTPQRPIADPQPFGCLIETDQLAVIHLLISLFCGFSIVLRHVRNLSDKRLKTCHKFNAMVSPSRRVLEKQPRRFQGEGIGKTLTRWLNKERDGEAYKRISAIIALIQKITTYSLELRQQFGHVPGASDERQTLEDMHDQLDIEMGF